jgi:hypothetical protein
LKKPVLDKLGDEPVPKGTAEPTKPVLDAAGLFEVSKDAQSDESGRLQVRRVSPMVMKPSTLT